MAIPHSVLAAGWIPFVVVLVLTLLFSFIYVRYFQSRYESEVCSSIASVLAVAVALLTTALVPVDIFLVSFMKDSDGHFKDWAKDNTTRQSIENGVLYAYYALYSCVVLFVFLILPFCYFFYEEGGDEDEDVSTKSKVCTAAKFTLVFVFIASVLMLIGAFAPMKHAPSVNSTEWEKIKNLFEDLGTYRGEDALSFVISSLTLIGMIAVVLYTAYGMSAWPMDLVKGRRSVARERAEVASNRAERQAEIDAIKIKYRTGRRRMTSRDRRRLEELEDEDRLMARRELSLERVERSCVAKCAVVLRPFQVVFGIIFFAMALLVFLSLLLTNIDKVLHSLGPKMGYALPERSLPNPIDITLVFAQKVFPVDYILMAGIIMYFFFCSMGGLQHIGIWCCWIRMYKIRPQNTKPQGLLFLCFILMFIVLALNVVIYQITPQYSTYGSQHYIQYPNGSHTGGKLMACSTKAPRDECEMTRMSMLLTRFFYKIWFFGACYYYASWVFLGVFVIGFVVSLMRKRRSSVEGAVDRDDFDSDDDAAMLDA